ncbi:MAG: hypothetical protein WHV26_12235 [Spirochaetota bacterium]
MTLTLTEQEKELLTQLLEQFIQEKLIEERHTFKREYRTIVMEKEGVAEQLLKKISQL